MAFQTISRVVDTTDFLRLLNKYGYSEEDVTDDLILDITNILSNGDLSRDIEPLLQKIQGQPLEQLLFANNKDVYDQRISGESYLLRYAGEESEIVCINSKCMSTAVTRQRAQLRSADEGENIIFTCADCGQRWVQ